MPMNNKTIGKDIALVLMTPQGPLSLNGIDQFKKRPDIKEEKIIELDGNVDHLEFPGGWSGSFQIVRGDSTIDDYFAAWEGGYYAGINQQYAQLFETISEPNGNITQYQYKNVALKWVDGGTWTGESSVRYSIDFVASRRLKTA